MPISFHDMRALTFERRYEIWSYLLTQQICQKTHANQSISRRNMDCYEQHIQEATGS